MVAFIFISIPNILLVFPTPETDKITRLPGQPIVNFDQHSGYIPVDKNSKRKLFYYFVEAENEPASKPVILWLRGGNIYFIFFYFLSNLIQEESEIVVLFVLQVLKVLVALLLEEHLLHTGLSSPPGGVWSKTPTVGIRVISTKFNPYIIYHKNYFKEKCWMSAKNVVYR